jgi:trimeric autotransporter adhesin
MLRNLAVLTIAFAAFTVLASAQTTTTGTTTTSLADSTPQENVAGVSQRSPGTWVKVALARHSGLQALRLTGPRNGVPNTTEAQARFGSSAASSSAATTTGGLSSLLSLVSQLGSTGSLGNLTSLLGSQTTGSTTNSTTTGTNYTLADLIAMGQAAGATQKTINTSTSTPDSATSRSKLAAVAQTSTTTGTTTTTQPSFGTRWLTAMTSTFFTAITVGFQTSAFVNVLKDAIRPLFLPTTKANTNSNSASSGSGIENIASSDPNNPSGSSTL